VAAAAAAGGIVARAFSRTLVCSSPAPPHAADWSPASAADRTDVTARHVTHIHIYIGLH